MKQLGNIKEARPNLGNMMPIFVYRLLELSLIEVLTKRYGKEECDEIIREAGELAGVEFSKMYLDTTMEFNDFIASLQQKLVENKIGILRIEHADLTTGEVLLTVYEDLDCSGLSVYDETQCVYDEGFLAGILECYSGKKFKVREIDCWATGERACRFIARANNV